MQAQDDRAREDAAYKGIDAFTKDLNDPNAKEDIANCKVVAAYPKGSPDIKSSTERVPAYTEQMQKIRIVSELTGRRFVQWPTSAPTEKPKE